MIILFYWNFWLLILVILIIVVWGILLCFILLWLEDLELVFCFVSIIIFWLGVDV